MYIYTYTYTYMGLTRGAFAAGALNGGAPSSVLTEQALVCLSNREIVDASRGRTFHCKIANRRIVL